MSISRTETSLQGDWIGILYIVAVGVDWWAVLDLQTIGNGTTNYNYKWYTNVSGLSFKDFIAHLIIAMGLALLITFGVL